MAWCPSIASMPASARCGALPPWLRVTPHASVPYEPMAPTSPTLLAVTSDPGVRDAIDRIARLNLFDVVFASDDTLPEGTGVDLWRRSPPFERSERGGSASGSTRTRSPGSCVDAGSSRPSRVRSRPVPAALGLSRSSSAPSITSRPSTTGMATRAEITSWRLSDACWPRAFVRRICVAGGEGRSSSSRSPARRRRAFGSRSRPRFAPSLKCPFLIGEKGPFTVTCSAGAATSPFDGTSIDVLLRVADRRLYSAKRGGRARVVASG